MTAAMLMSDVGGTVVQVGAVQATAQTAGASFTAACPTHQAGDLLVAAVFVDNASGITTAAGWTLIGNSGEASVFAMIATGAAHTLAAGGYTADNDICAHIRCFRGVSGLTAAQLVEVNFNTGNDNPPALTPTFGLAGAWIAAYGHTSGTPGAGPSGYSDYLETTNGTGNLASGSLALVSSSENPGTFGGAGGTQKSMTVAVRAP